MVEREFLHKCSLYCSKVEKKDAYTDLDIALAALDFYEMFHKILELATRNKEMSERVLELTNSQVSRGVSTKSHVLRYVCHPTMLNMDTAMLTNQLSLIEPVAYLVNKLGRGILILTPGNAVKT